MTGVFFQALNTVKNYFIHSLAPGGDRPQGGQHLGQERQRLPGRPLSRFIPFGTRGGRNLDSGSRKRPAERLIELELEITDDEDQDDNLPWPVWSEEKGNHTKRFRPLEEELPLSMTEANRKIPTRGSGIPPNIEGLDRQPWEFNFRKKRSLKPHEQLRCENASASVELSRGSLLRDEAPTSSQQSSHFHKVVEHSQSLGSSNEILQSKMESLGTDFGNFNFRMPSGVKKKNIEVVTLDNDVDDSRHKHKVEAGLFPPRRMDPKIFQKKMRSPMKCKKKNPKPFSDFIRSLGRTSVDPMSSTIRLEERNMYAELIKKFDSLKQPFGNTSLQLLKLNQTDVQAIYQKFPDGCSSPTVTFRSRFDSTFTSPLSSSTPRLVDRIALERNKRLFSASSVPKILTLTPKPPLIDLEKEDEEKFVNGLSPAPSSTSVDGSSVDLPLHTSFVDLSDALSSSRCPTAEKKDDDSELMSETSSRPDTDSDIAILSEIILNKYKGRRLNSLALEQNLSPYANKGWLDELSSSYRENQKAREKQIREHLETIDVIQKESTLETDLRERMRKRLTLTEIIVLEEPVPELPEITAQMKEVVDLAKRPGRQNDVLATVFNIDITRGDVTTLGPCKWLNDNVINIYMELIANRSKQINSYPKVHVFTTFFYPKLLKEGYSNTLKRWTRKVDVFSNDLVIFPIHLGLHWCLACADFRNKTLKYYDSLGGRNDTCLHALLNYLANEMKERKGELLEKDDWELENVEEIPMQQNGSDCGVFSCKFAEYLSRDAKLTFLQENMNYYRERMIYEIIKQDLLHP